MCGFIVYFDKKKVDFKSKLKSALDLIKHRGPNDTQIITEKNFGLGFARLSIQDTSIKGRQPMVSQNKRYILVFNGEIYNFKELRKKLILKGASFKSNSDTEVLLKLYEYEGESFIHKIDGMFSIVIIDKIKNCLFLARDRFGIKPLYLYKNKNTFFISSEIKAFIPFSLEDSSWSFNSSFLKEYIMFRDLTGENTFIQNVKKILPGYTMKIDQNLNITKKRYFNLSVPNLKINKLSIDENVEYLEELLIKNVKSHLISDVPIATTLSGGVDSSLLTALTTKYNNSKITTYSIIFEENKSNGRTIDESKYINKFYSLYSTKRKNIILNSKKLSNIWNKLVWHNEDPLSLPNSAGIYLISKISRSKHKVIIGGEGADEVFAGYDTFRDKNISILEGNYVNQNIDSIFKDHQSPLIFRENILKKFENYSLKNKMSFILNTKLQTLNNRLDKMSMASGVEFRVPFQTKSLLDFSASLPDNQLVNNNVCKFILKKLAEKYLPKSIIYRKKIGFSVPINMWLKKKEFTHHIEEIFNEKSILKDLFKQEFLDKTQFEFFNKKDSFINSNSNKLWMLANIQKFHSMFIKNRKQTLYK